MKTIREIISKELKLNNAIDYEKFSIYPFNNKKYIIFMYEEINRDNIRIILEIISMYYKHYLNNWKSIVVVGKTSQSFLKKDLSYFDGVNTFVSFYLINEKTRESYFNSNWIFALGMNYKNVIKKINKILLAYNIISSI